MNIIIINYLLCVLLNNVYFYLSVRFDANWNGTCCSSRIINARTSKIILLMIIYMINI